MSKYHPPNFKLVFDPERIATALWITTPQALKEFQDGRVVSRFSEYWTEKLYGFKKSDNTNTAMYDGIISNPLIGDMFISVRSLTKTGIKFQQSKFIGSGRSCSISDLKSSLISIDFEIVVDIIDFPTVILSVVSSDRLLQLVDAGKVTPSGLKRDQYYHKIFHTTHSSLKVGTIDPYSCS